MHPLEKQNVFLDTVEIKRVDSFNKETSDKIAIVGYIKITVTIRLFGNFLSFYEEIIEAQGFLFYIILSNYVRTILLFYLLFTNMFIRWDKHRDISQTWFHVCRNTR